MGRTERVAAMTTLSKKAVYDGTVRGTSTTFSRAAATVNNLGQSVASGSRRFRGDSVGYCPPPKFTATGVTIGAGTVELWGTGYDHDNTTPMLIANDSAGNATKIYTGESPTLVRSLSWSGNDIMQGAVSGKTYMPRGAIIWYGLIVIACQRSESGVIKGISLVYTNDDGATLAVSDLPANTEAAGADSGLSRMNQWAFPSGFPVGDLNDTEDVWLPIADYIANTGSTKGGQIGLARATRTGTGDWTFEGFRSIYDRWIAGDAGGHHSHGAAMGSNAMYSHWGDVNYRNIISKHELTLDADWLTNPVTTTVEWHGGYSTTATDIDASPQQVSFVPAPGGGHFGSADLNSEHVLKFEDDGGPVLTRMIGRVEYTVAGTLFRGLELLHLSWFPGKGWIGGGSSSRAFHLSRDGQTFACLALPSSLGDRIRILGNKIVATNPTTRELWTADLPQVYARKPLQLNPGGVNRNNVDWAFRTAPGVGNTVRQVYNDAGTYRYTDDDAALNPQPAADPPVTNAKMYELKTTGTDRFFGRWYMNDYSVNLSQGLACDLWVLPMDATQGVPCSLQLITNAERAWTNHASNRWSSVMLNDSTASTSAAIELSFRSPIASGEVATNSYLTCVSSIALNAKHPMYPCDLGATVPDEIETFGFSVDSTWTVAMAIQLPENYKQSATDSVLLTIRQDDNNYIEVIDDASNATPRTELNVVKAGSSVGTIALATGRLQRETPITLIVTCDGTDIAASAIHHAGDADIVTGTLAAQTLAPVEVINGPISGEKAAIELFSLASSDESSDATQRETLIRSSALLTGGSTTLRRGIRSAFGNAITSAI